MSKTVLTKGIDVSNVGQGRISDWSKVAKNIDFAILKLGNGYESEPFYTDAQFIRNADACEKYGIPYGVYVYQYFTSVEKARAAAKKTVELLRRRKLDYPVFLDIEENKVFRLGKAKILEMAKAFCEVIEAAGYTYGTYCSTGYFNSHLTDKWYDSKVKWLAQYYKEVTYKGKYDIWQYSSTGSVPGINGNVDMNFCYISVLEGDVDHDGKVTAADARKILRIAAQLDSASDSQTADNADMNDDGRFTAEDARLALLKASGVKT